MRLVIFIVVLLGAALVIEVAAHETPSLSALEKMSGLKAEELEMVFGMKLDDIERSMFGLEAKEITMALNRADNLKPDEVLNLLQQASDFSVRLYNNHTIQDLIDISKVDPELCPWQKFKRIIEMHQKDMNDINVAFRENLSRYCREQFNELIEYCFQETKLQAYPEVIWHRSEKKARDATELEKFILNGLSSEYILKELDQVTDLLTTADLLARAYDRDLKLVGNYTIWDFIKPRDGCNLNGLKQMIEMYHGNDADMRKRVFSTRKENLARFGRLCFNRMIEYCLRWAPGEIVMDKDLKPLIRGLFKISKPNTAREYAGLLTPMESVILRMPLERED